MAIISPQVIGEDKEIIKRPEKINRKDGYRLSETSGHVFPSYLT